MRACRFVPVALAPTTTPAFRSGTAVDIESAMDDPEELTRLVNHALVHRFETFPLPPALAAADR